MGFNDGRTITYVDYWSDRIPESPIFQQLHFPKSPPPTEQKGSAWAGAGTPMGFSGPISELIQTPGLQKLTSQDAEMSEDITKDILEFMRKADEEITDEEKDPLKDEKELLARFKEVTPEDFNDNWEETEPFLVKAYRKNQIDTKFYSSQFKKSLQPDKKPKGQKAPKKILFDSVKKNLLNKWEKLLDEKQEANNQAIIQKLKQRLKSEFEGKLQKMKSLMQILAPFELKPGQLFKMGKEEWKRGNLDIVKTYAELLARDTSLKALADLMGRVSQAEKEQERETYMKTVIIPEYKPVHSGKSEIMGVRESDDIANMLSSEMLLLCDENLELLFYKKFVEKKLQTYEYQGKYLTARTEEVPDVRIKEVDGKRGPYILCIDTSGSMQGSPEIVCKVLAFALTKRALAEKRKCYLITFSCAIQTFELTHMGNSMHSLLDFLSMGFNGGTDVEPALHETINKIDKDEGFKKADVLMMSDFQTGSLSKDLIAKMKRAKENKTKFNSLVITSGLDSWGMGGGANQTVLDIFDNNWSFNPDNRQEVVTLAQKLNPPAQIISNFFS